MAYQINLTGKEIDERLQNIGTANDPNDEKGSLYARVKKANASTSVNRLSITTLSSANKKNQADIAEIGSRQTNIEEVVSVERSNVFFRYHIYFLILETIILLECT